MKYLNAFITAAAIYIAAAFPILAQSFNTTGSEFAVQQAGKSVPGAMMMCLNSSGQAVPCGSAGALPIPISGGGPYSFTPLTPMQSGLAITSATSLTVPSGATYAVICAEGQNVRYSTDGTTTPTASVGMLLLTNQCVSFSGPLSLSNFKAIQAAATATLDVSYFK